MSNNSSNDFWGWLIGVGVVVFVLMWLFETGPFEKPSYSYTPYSTTSSSGSNPSFTGNSSGSSSKVFSRKASFYNYDGSYCYGTYDLYTDGTYEYYNGSRAQRPSNSPFNYFVSYGGGFAYFY